MSMFDNIVFDEFTLLEGEQANNYKYKKVKEKYDQEERDYTRRIKRRAAGRVSNISKDYKTGGTEKVEKNIRDDMRRDFDANHMVGRYAKNKDNNDFDHIYAIDAANRHIRKEEKKK